MDAPAISAVSLRQSLASGRLPLVIDVRSSERFLEAPDLLRGALRRDPARVEDLSPQSAGLAALSQGLSINFPDDHAMLAQGLAAYDALYAWCRKGKAEVHTWNPNLAR